MTTKTIPTAAEVEEMLTRIVDRRGRDYVYEQVPIFQNEEGTTTGCMYLDGPEPSCLIGHLLHELGVPIEQIQDMEGQSADIVWTKLVEDETWISTSSASPLARALRGAQRRQDLGATWGEALDTFKTLIGREV